MAKFVEMDERIKFKDQIGEKGIEGSVILINKFNVDQDKIEQFLKDWTEDANPLNNSQDLFLHNYIKTLARVLYSLIMQFGSR